MSSNKELLKSINVGDVITADLLNKITAAINRNTQGFAGPRQIETSADTQFGGTIGNEVFDSTSGTETTVTITDSNGDTHDIERVDTIVLTEQTSGRTMTLNITYPL